VRAWSWRGARLLENRESAEKNAPHFPSVVGRECGVVRFSVMG
jgi:hypothetical protein